MNDLVKKKTTTKKQNHHTHIYNTVPEDREKLISSVTSFICFHTQMKLYNSPSTITAHSKISIMTILSVHLQHSEQWLPRELIMAGNE